MKVAEWNCDCEIQAIYMINYGCKLNACRYLLLIVCYDVEYVFHTVKYTSYANHFFLLLFVFGRGQKSIEQIFEYTKAAATIINGTKCGTKIIPFNWRHCYRLYQPSLIHLNMNLTEWWVSWLNLNCAFWFCKHRLSKWLVILFISYLDFLTINDRGETRCEHEIVQTIFSFIHLPQWNELTHSFAHWVSLSEHFS